MHYRYTTIAAALLSVAFATTDNPAESCTIPCIFDGSCLGPKSGQVCYGHGSISSPQVLQVLPNTNSPECQKECFRNFNCQSTKVQIVTDGDPICTLFSQSLLSQGFTTSGGLSTVSYTDKTCLDKMAGRCDIHNNGFELYTATDNGNYASGLHPWSWQKVETNPSKSTIKIGSNNDGSGFATTLEGSRFLHIHKVGGGNIFLDQSLRTDPTFDGEPYTLQYLYNLKAFQPVAGSDGNPEVSRITVVWCQKVIDAFDVPLTGSNAPPRNKWLRRVARVTNPTCSLSDHEPDFHVQIYSGANPGAPDFSIDLGLDNFSYLPQ